MILYILIYTFLTSFLNTSHIFHLITVLPHELDKSSSNALIKSPVFSTVWRLPTSVDKYSTTSGCSEYISTVFWKSLLPLLLLPINVSPFSRIILVFVSTGYSLTPNKQTVTSGLIISFIFLIAYCFLLYL